MLHFAHWPKHVVYMVGAGQLAPKPTRPTLTRPTHWSTRPTGWSTRPNLCLSLYYQLAPLVGQLAPGWSTRPIV